MKKSVYVILIIVVGLAIFFVTRSGKTKKADTNYKVSGGVVAIPEVKMALPVVNVTANGFEPAELKVRLGAKVTWNNKSGKDIEINSAKHPTHEEFPQLNLNKVVSEGSVSLIFNEPGTYKYHNHLIPAQTGQIVVE